MDKESNFNFIELLHENNNLYFNDKDFIVSFESKPVELYIAKCFKCPICSYTAYHHTNMEGEPKNKPFCPECFKRANIPLMEENEMKLNDERRKALTEYLGECFHEGSMPINCGYRCIKCGDTYITNRTFATDSDMMAVYRKLVDNNMWDSFYWSSGIDEIPISGLFYIPETFCWLVWSFIKNPADAAAELLIWVKEEKI